MHKDPLKRFAYLAVLAAMVLHMALLVLQNVSGMPVWLVELSRFIPFYWLLLPLCLATLLSLGMSPFLALASLANVALFAIVTMDLHWNLPDDKPPPGTHLRVLSYNIKALNARHKPGGLDEIETEVQLHQPDIVALQDAQKWLTGNNSHTIETARPVFGLPYVVAFDQYVLASRFPLRDCKQAALGSGPEDPDYLQCTVVLESGLVQLVTTHLVSPRHALMATRNDWLGGLDAWRLNVADRMLQSQALLAALAHMPKPLILMGDFNSAEQSTAIANLKLAGLHDAFSEAGRGWGYTHGHALRLALDIYRIDHILLSAGITARTATVGDSDASEHNPVIADLLIHP